MSVESPTSSIEVLENSNPPVDLAEMQERLRTFMQFSALKWAVFMDSLVHEEFSKNGHIVVMAFHVPPMKFLNDKISNQFADAWTKKVKEKASEKFQYNGKAFLNPLSTFNTIAFATDSPQEDLMNEMESEMGALFLELLNEFSFAVNKGKIGGLLAEYGFGFDGGAQEFIQQGDSKVSCGFVSIPANTIYQAPEVEGAMGSYDLTLPMMYLSLIKGRRGSVGKGSVERKHVQVLTAESIDKTFFAGKNSITKRAKNYFNTIDSRNPDDVLPPVFTRNEQNELNFSLDFFTVLRTKDASKVDSFLSEKMPELDADARLALKTMSMNLFSLVNSLDAVHPYVSVEEEKAYKAYQANIARWVIDCLERTALEESDSADFAGVGDFLRQSSRAPENIENASKVDLSRASFQHQVFGGRFEKDGFNTYYVSCDIRNFAYQNFVAIMNNFRSIQGQITNSMALLTWSALLRQAFFAPNQDIRRRIASMKAFFDEKEWSYCMDRDGGDEIVFAIQVPDSVVLNEDEFRGLAETLDLRMVVAELSSRLGDEFNAKDFLDQLEAADKEIKKALADDPSASPLIFLLK